MNHTQTTGPLQEANRMPRNPIPRPHDRQDERSIDRLIPIAELMGETWAQHGYHVQTMIREHVRSWPGGRTGRVRLIAACLEGARRAGGRS
jgi:hypothetical protein